MNISNLENHSTTVLEESEMFTRLVGCGIRSMRLMFKTKMLIYQSEAKFVVKFCSVESLIFKILFMIYLLFRIDFYF